MAMFDNLGRFTVLVDGEQWTETKSLGSAGSRDKVFVVDLATGTIEFGDGISGRQPEAGAELTVSYRQGDGEAGNVEVSVTTLWPPPTCRYLVATKDRTIRIRPYDEVAEHYSGVKRVRYFPGQLLTASDFQDDQQYHRRMRCLDNRLHYGSGIITGLDVGVSSVNSMASVVVAPGYAIDAQGRELILNASVDLEIGERPSPQYVTIAYTEREADRLPSPDGGQMNASRIEEGSLVRLVPDHRRAALAIGRVVLGASGWEVDPTFQPLKSR